MLDSSQGLIASFQNLEDIVECERNSFQIFLEEKLLVHHVEMDFSLNKMKEEIFHLCSHVSTLEFYSSSSSITLPDNNGIRVPTTFKRSCHLRGSNENGHNT